MALTPGEIEYIKQLRKAGADDENVLFYLEKRRKKEAEMNAPKEKGVLQKGAEFLQNVGGGAIQAGGELAVGLPGQLSRLLPGDQSADQSSFYNKTQRLLESTKQDMTKQGIETEGAGFGFGKGVMNIAAGSVMGGSALKLANKSKLLTQLGLKVGTGLPGQIATGAARGATEGLGFDLAQGKAPGSGTIVGGVLGGAMPIVQAGVGLLGKGTKKAGEALYKTAIRPNTDEAGMIIQATAKGKTLPVTRADTALKYGVQGTEKTIGVQGVRKADKIFKETIAPALEKSKATHNIDDIFATVEKQIANTKSVTRKQELMEGLEALKEEFATTGKKVFTTGDLQAEKSALDKFTQTKVFKGKEVADGYNQVKNTLANVMREQVRTDLAKTGVKNAKELYRDYTNLAELEKIGIKGITEGGKRGGSGTAIMTILDKYLTPIRTIGGNTLYKAGKSLQFTGPKGIKTLGSFLRKGGYKLIGDVLTKI